jgi:hypothetical protein
LRSSERRLGGALALHLLGASGRRLAGALGLLTARRGAASGPLAALGGLLPTVVEPVFGLLPSLALAAQLHGALALIGRRGTPA